MTQLSLTLLTICVWRSSETCKQTRHRSVRQNQLMEIISSGKRHYLERYVYSRYHLSIYYGDWLISVIYSKNLLTMVVFSSYQCYFQKTIRLKRQLCASLLRCTIRTLIRTEIYAWIFLMKIGVQRSVFRRCYCLFHPYFQNRAQTIRFKLELLITTLVIEWSTTGWLVNGPKDMRDNSNSVCFLELCDTRLLPSLFYTFSCYIIVQSCSFKSHMVCFIVIEFLDFINSMSPSLM